MPFTPTQNEGVLGGAPSNYSPLSTVFGYTDYKVPRQDWIATTQGGEASPIAQAYQNYAADLYARSNGMDPSLLSDADRWAIGGSGANSNFYSPVTGQLSYNEFAALYGAGLGNASAAAPAAPAAPAGPVSSPTQETIDSIVNKTDRAPAAVQQYTAHPTAIPSADSVQLATWTPTMGSIDPATETVQGQMQGLLAANSPYIQLARQNALGTANNRGLLNSSIAAGAGEKAAIESALPIANADAQLYMQQSMANQQYQNQAGQFNTAEKNAIAKAQYQTMLQDILNRNNAQYDMEKMSFDEGIKTRLTALQQDYAVELETLKQSYNIQQNRDTQMGVMYQDSMKSIATFLSRAELTPEQQSSGVKVIIDNLNAGLQFMAGIGAPAGNFSYQKPATSYNPNPPQPIQPTK